MNKSSLIRYATSLLCGAILAIASNPAPGAEIFLPVQGLSFSGQLTVPACAISLSQSVHFDLEQQRDVYVQRQHLLLSQCDVEGVDVAFQAETWPGQANRGTLSGTRTHRRSTAFHYRIGPDTDAPPDGADIVLPLMPDAGSVALEQDSAVPGINPEGHYFSLQGTAYPYRLPPAGNTVTGRMNIPFIITLHHDTAQPHDSDEEALNGLFRLRVTYR